MVTTDRTIQSYDDWRNNYWERRTNPKAITAAAFARPILNVRQSYDRATDPSASEAWRMWDRIGEVWFATTFKARQVSRLEWKIYEDGQLVPAAETKEILDRITAPDGLPDVTEDLGLNLEVAGKVYYLYTLQDDEWHVTSTVEKDLKELREEAFYEVVGLNRHPAYRSKVTSPVLANMDTIRELALLQALQRAQARNRIAQRGFVLYAAEAEFEGNQDFAAQLEQAFTAPLANEYAPEAVTPPFIKFPKELIEFWKHFKIDSPYDESLNEKIEAVTRRLALGLDLPPEALLGLGSATHWTVWSITESTYRAHVAPLAIRVGQVLSEAIGTSTGRKVELEPDPTKMLAKRAAVVDALEAYDREIVSDDYVRKVMDAGPEDKPTGPANPSLRPSLRRLSADRNGQPDPQPGTRVDERFTGNM